MKKNLFSAILMTLSPLVRASSSSAPVVDILSCAGETAVRTAIAVDKVSEEQKHQKTTT